MRAFKSHIAIFTLMMIFSCIEPYTPKISEVPDPVFVVEGLITDEPGPYQVTVSKTIPLNRTSIDDKISGVTVYIDEREGLTEVLGEVEPGIYETSAIQGKVGSSYRVRLELGGKTYSSTWETLEASPAMDSLKTQVVNLGKDNENNNINAVEYMVSFDGREQEGRFFRYNFEETWLARSTYPSYYEYLGFDQKATRDPQIRRCYKSRNIHPTTLLSTSELSTNSIEDYVLKTISGEDERYVHRHTLLVSQLAMDEEEFNYWQLVKEANEDIGTLYDKQPYTVYGNITNDADPDDRILGYFSASGIKRMRKYLDTQPGVSEQYYCGEDFLTYMKAELGSQYEIQLTALLNNGYMLYYLIYSSGPFPAVIGATLAKDPCIDCRLNGGTVEKPEFWYD